jgi:hypothetical protein
MFVWYGTHRGTLYMASTTNLATRWESGGNVTFTSIEGDLAMHPSGNMVRLSCSSLITVADILLHHSFLITSLVSPYYSIHHWSSSYSYRIVPVLSLGRLLLVCGFLSLRHPACLPHHPLGCRPHSRPASRRTCPRVCHHSRKP